MMLRYSIAEARNRFAEIVHNLEHVGRIEVTRRGRPVAVLISAEEYARLCEKRPSFWEAYKTFRKRFDAVGSGIDDTFFEGLRDRSAPREVELE